TNWQFLGGELQMYYATVARNCRWRGSMKQEWSHEDRITPTGDTRLYLKVEIDPEVTASPKSENTMPILEGYVRRVLVAKWGEQIAEDIEPLEIQKWFNSLHNKDEYEWTTVSKIRGIMRGIFEVGIIHKKVTKNPVESLQTSTKTSYRAIKITPAQTLPILRSMMENILHFTLVFVVAATALRSSEVLALRWADIVWGERKIRI